VGTTNNKGLSCGSNKWQTYETPSTGASRMSEWRGLLDASHVASTECHWGLCTTCGASCAPARPCRCCLMAEWGQAQVLRKQVQRVRDLHVPSQTVKSRISGLPVCCRCHDIYPCETLRALAGDGHE
jgi:hypothetical protein